MMVTLAPLILVMQKPTNAFTLVLNVLITIFVLLTSAKMEFVIIPKRKTVMTVMHALLILATQLLDANIPLLFALMATLAPLKLATR
jgi:D-alanyl-lipoteichoic acid acyltransferase DltB (MBOAT superfamily)